MAAYGFPGHSRAIMKFGLDCTERKTFLCSEANRNAEFFQQLPARVFTSDHHLRGQQCLAPHSAAPPFPCLFPQISATSYLPYLALKELFLPSCLQPLHCPPGHSPPCSYCLWRWLQLSSGHFWTRRMLCWATQGNLSCCQLTRVLSGHVNPTRAFPLWAVMHLPLKGEGTWCSELLFTNPTSSKGWPIIQPTQYLWSFCFADPIATGQILFTAHNYYPMVA